ncbi:hypothetical protein DD549_18820 [Shewanella algae]|nr:hypothetical protein DD549_18820 [Shewanella algae]
MGFFHISPWGMNGSTTGCSIPAWIPKLVSAITSAMVPNGQVAFNTLLRGELRNTKAAAKHLNH